MTARKYVAVCARGTTHDPVGLDAEPAWRATLAERVAVPDIDAALGVVLARLQRLRRAPAKAGVALLTPERLEAALAQSMGAA
jgi:hypothetical protein